MQEFLRIARQTPTITIEMIERYAHRLENIITEYKI
jgi:hypothetical protein